MSPIESLEHRIAPLRRQIINHPAYAAINRLEDLQAFMHFHVYAVWDFMSLLKALQSKLTCVQAPWFPVGEADTRFLINEIVVGEESDVDEEGQRTSHFELYRKAMVQAGTDTGPVDAFLAHLRQQGDLDAAFEAAGVPDEARAFVRFTFETIARGQSHVLAAVFTFGREDLIPGMFHSIVNDLHALQPEAISVFKYYLERHIEVDGDHHSHLALRMTEQLCGNDEARWKEAEEAVVASLQQRIGLWNGVLRTIEQRAASMPTAS